jgi:hypothetical protein
VIPVTRQPKPYRHADTFPFAGGERWRPLRLVLDDDTLAAEDINELIAFGDYDEVELFRTAAAALPRLEIQEPAEDFVPIHTVSNDGAGIFWVAHATRLRERTRETASTSGVDEETVYRARVFAAASEEMEADGFVTRHSFLLTERAPRDPSVYTPADAMALIGLALRLHGNRKIGADLADLALGGTTFHFVLGRELTYAGWRWYSGCAASSRATRDDTAINLGEAALERFERVLQIRDRLHAQAKIPSTPTAADELVFQFETLLLFLSAAFDATARVAHLVYFNDHYDEAGWRRASWPMQLTTAEPGLAALVADDTPGGTLLKLIARLRNTIHGEALRPITLQRGGTAPENPVELNGNTAARTVADIASLGDEPADWGLSEEHSRTYLSADRFVEALLPHAVALLNELMAGTAIERLSGVNPQKLMSPPPDVPSANPLEKMLSWEIRRRVRRLAGL